MIGGRRNRIRTYTDIWPGFVDALASLLMVVIFLLMVFVLAQYFLSEALSGRDEQLSRLNRELAELSDMLAIERQSNAELRETVGQLSQELQVVTASRDQLNDQLSTMTSQFEIATSTVDSLKAELEEAQRLVETDRERIKLQLGEIASLRDQIAALTKARDALESDVAKLRETAARTEAAEAESARLQGELEQALAALRTRDEEAESDEATIEEQLAEIQRLSQSVEALRAARERLEAELEKERTALAEANRQLAGERELTRASRVEVERLTETVAALRQELAQLSAALDLAESANEAKDAQILDLGRRLNRALADKVEELARYRSEFFGRLREVLGDRQDIRIVGDRFVFQSEVLFDSGSAEFAAAGQEQIGELAETLKQIAEEIPDDIDWVLRVDGHTDVRPIRSGQFRSNWELSTARAIAVVRVLIDNGVPPERLVAAGFGEFHPIEPGDSLEAYRRNRRIEFKLTER